MKLFLIALLFTYTTYAKELLLVSVQPFHTLISLLAEGAFTVEVLLPPSADYHMYELSPRDVVKIKRARAVFVSGLPLGGWEEKVEEVSGNKAIPLFASPKESRKLTDPHPWLSPRKMREALIRAYEGLISIDPERTELYRKRLRNLEKKLNNLDSAYKKTLASCKYRKVPIVHPSLGYLSEDYGIEEISILHGDVHGGISPASLLKFVKKLRRAGINFIFEVYGSPSKVANLLKKRYGLKVYKLNVKMVPMDSRRDYFSIMEYNLKVLKEALICGL